MDVSIPCPCPPENGEPRHPYEFGVDKKGNPTDEIVSGGDTVTLRDKLDFIAATACRKHMLMAESDDEDALGAERLARITEAYILFGIERWTLANGKDIDPTHENIRRYLLSGEQPLAALLVSDEAEKLYNPVVLFPLALRASRSWKPTPTDASTSAPMASSKRPRKPSARSSISTTRTASTEPTT